MLEGSEFSIAYWIGFILFIATLVIIDRFLVSKNSTVLLHSIYGTGFWFIFAAIFMIFLIFISDNFIHNHSIDFFAAYII